MKRIIPFLICLLLVSAAIGQDIHFSHFFAAPLNLNPALTGHFDGKYRVGGNYKNQWQSVTEPYRTFSGYGDYKLSRKSNRNQFSAGLLLIHDESGDGDLTVNKAFGSLAYQKSFHFPIRINAGIGVGYVQKSLDFSKLFFDNQWTNAGFNENILSGEAVGEEKLNYLDVQAGVVIDYIFPDDHLVYVGLNYAHAFTPKESFYNNANELGDRPVLHGGGRFLLDDGLVIEPSFIFMDQNKAREFIGGANAGLDLKKQIPTMLWAGFYIRGSGDAIPVAGIQYNNIKALVSYDINFSTLKPASENRGGIEFSIQYIGDIIKEPGIIVVPCIRY